MGSQKWSELLGETKLVGMFEARSVNVKDTKTHILHTRYEIGRI